MKRVVAVLVLAVALSGVLAVPAMASYFMTYNQAKHSTKELVQGACEELSQCTGYGVGKCYENTRSNWSCWGAVFYPGAYQGEEEECDRLVRWGVNSQGVIALRGIQAVHCVSV